MNYNLNYEGYESNLVISRPLEGGMQYRFKFENRYGASVVKHDFSYGHREDLWELAVLLYDDDDWGLTYSTPITDDVIGHLTDEEVRDLLKRIKEL